MEVGLNRIKERCWPLIISLTAGAQSLENQRDFFAALNRWLDRGQPFAVLRLFADAEALVHPEGGARLAKQWLQDNVARMRHSVLGIASVVPESAFEKMSRMDIEKAFGGPGGVFRDHGSALTWLAEQVFKPRAMAFDLAGIEAILLGLQDGRP
jgi:hypothetical protein